MIRQAICFVFLLFFTMVNRAGAQQNIDSDTLPENALLEKQWSLGAMIHSNGWGLKFHRGHNVTNLRQFMWEIEFSTYKSTKELRITSQFPEGRPYLYGKLNYLYFLRGGVGQQHILNRKPYWGGVQLSWLYYGGVSLGFTKPVYLYIIYTDSGYPEEERYDPEIHSYDNIYGRGSFFSGFFNVGFHPGVYLKTGLDFEFGTRNARINSLEIGGTLDFSPIPVPLMAYNPKQQFFLTIYLSVMIGKRYLR